MLDFFKNYANEVGAGAIVGDSFMMILACLLSSNFATYSLNTNIIALVISLYFVPYMINYE
jgi:threonine/homoserine/homoserine lactone efflux protein